MREEVMEESTIGLHFILIDNHFFLVLKYIISIAA
jgi:hypothetical protein